jgi:hypothetical protein
MRKRQSQTRVRESSDASHSRLFEDVELLAQHHALSCELRQRGLDPAPAGLDAAALTHGSAGTEGRDMPASGAGRRHKAGRAWLRQAAIGLSIALGCLIGSAGLSAAYASFQRDVLAPWLLGRKASSLTIATYGDMSRRSALVHLVRDYRTRADPRISAESAAEALNAVQHVGLDAALSLMPELRRPERDYAPLEVDLDRARALFGEAAVQQGLPEWEASSKKHWPKILLPLAAEGRLTAEQAAYLEALATHPALDDFEHLAHASAVDLTWRFDPRTVEVRSAHDVPFASFWGVTNAVHAQIARAAFALQAGDAAAAEHALADLIAAGVLLHDNATFALETLVAAAIVKDGVEALEVLYEATGRPADAERLRQLRGQAEQMPDFYRMPGASTADERTRQIIELFQNPNAPLGAKWEALYVLGGMDLCGFTPQEFRKGSLARDSFEKQVAQILVRYPGERWLLDLVRRTPDELRKEYGEADLLGACQLY